MPATAYCSRSRSSPGPWSGHYSSVQFICYFCSSFTCILYYVYLMLLATGPNKVFLIPDSWFIADELGVTSWLHVEHSWPLFKKGHLTTIELAVCAVMCVCVATDSSNGWCHRHQNRRLYSRPHSHESYFWHSYFLAYGHFVEHMNMHAISWCSGRWVWDGLDFAPMASQLK